MRLIYYQPVTNKTSEHLNTIIHELVSGDEIETCKTIVALSGAVRKHLGESALAVLLAADQRDLQDLLILKDWISSLRVILIVPDSKNETISAGHLLQPRLLSFADSDLTDFSAVLARMIRLMMKEKR